MEGLAHTLLAKILILHQEKVKELERKLNFLEEGINLKQEKQPIPEESSEQEVVNSCCGNLTTSREQNRKYQVHICRREL